MASPRLIARSVCALGLALASFVSFFKSAGGISALWFEFLFVLSPWLVVGALTLLQRNIAGIAIGAFLMLLFECLAYYATFINPSSSTAALVYVVKPFWQLIVFLPIGLIIGYAIGKCGNAPI